MALIGIFVITVIMACAAAGAVAALFNDESGLGKEFVEGIRAIGYIFLPVAGIMAAVPYLSQLIRIAFGPLFGAIGADPAIAATTFIAVDMGGYRLAGSLAETKESWIMAMMAGYMAGATIVFSIPVGLSLLEKRDHKYMALGVLSGVLSIPVGILIGSLLLIVLGPSVRPAAATEGASSHALALDVQTVLLNLTPLVVFVSLIAAGLYLVPGKMIRGFMVFGRVMDIAIKLVLVLVIVEYFTRIFYGDYFRGAMKGKGIFSFLLGGTWYFDPVVADGEDRFRALEVAGYIGMMLAGAFPMVYLIKKYLSRPLERAGRALGLEPAGAAGLLAAVANILAMFRLVREMRPKDKVLCIAFAVCSAFLFGDHLAFTANFQPNLILPVMVGKLSGGIFAFFLAYKLSVPRALELEKQEMADEVRAVLQHVPVLQGRESTITALGGGLTNRNYRVDTAGATYVLRIAGTGTEHLGIDRDRELACSLSAAEAGVGPEVVASLPEHHALLTGFVHGRLLKADDIRRPEVLRRVAQTLRRYHDHPVAAELGAFSPFATIRAYHAQACASGLAVPGELDGALELLGNIEKELHTDEPPCLCHNDLLPANFIDDGQSLRVIDWEYGGLGDRFFDLGNFAASAELDELQARELLAGYFGEVRPEHARRLHLMRTVSDLREATWGFVQAGISKLHEPEYYMDYGCKHLERFLTGAMVFQTGGAP